VIARKQVAEQNPAFRSLSSAVSIERNVAAALQPALSIKIGLAVPNVIEDRHARFAFLAHGSLGTSQNLVRLFFANHNVRRVWVLHAYDMIASIDMMNFPGHPARHI